MHLTWKRPDGFHGAQPTDYFCVDLDGRSRLWLHKSDKDQYPFRLSGGWEEKDHSVKLNNLINLLPEPDAKWLEHLKTAFHHSMHSEPSEYYQETHSWLKELKNFLKGDTWETDILSQALDSTLARLSQVEDEFLKIAKT